MVRDTFKLDAFQPLIFKGLEQCWNEVSGLMERDTKRLQQVFAPAKAEPRIERRPSSPPAHHRLNQRPGRQLLNHYSHFMTVI